MTWNEFKKYVDDMLDGKDADIMYIDIMRPCFDHPACHPEVIIEDNELTVYT